ncbi:hypothetical protein [Mesorhizobium sp. M0904]
MGLPFVRTSLDHGTAPTG